MLKQSLMYLLLSIMVVLLAEYLPIAMIYIALFFIYINVQLTSLFNMNGVVMRKVLILVLLPISIAAIPALSYRLIKGRRMPYFIEITWLIWLIIVLSTIIIG